MSPVRLFRTATVRLAVGFSVVFATGGLVLLIAFSWMVSTFVQHPAADALRTEMAVLQAEAARPNGDSLARQIREREQTPAVDAFLYRMEDVSGRLVEGDARLAGLRPGPGTVDLVEGGLHGAHGREHERETVKIRTLGERLPDGGLLIIGHNDRAAEEVREWMWKAALWGGVGVVLLALAGGAVAGWVFLQRLERLNAAAARIMDGRLDERMPQVGLGDEFDRLSVNLNAMLDRIQALMEGFRQVSSDVAHDLRTPLARLRQKLEQARQTATSTTDYEAAVDAAMAEMDQLLATFGAVLRISQIEAGDGRDHFGDVDLSAVLERLRQAYEPAAEDSGRALLGEIAPGLVVRGDGDLLVQAFANLVENALKHAPPGSKVTVGLRRGEDGAATAFVADDGPGVPEEERERVVRRFYRLDRSRSTPGAGLGLSLVAAVAGLHGLAWRLTDNHPGLRVELVFSVIGDAARG